ncbi:hypothetical protein [Demequina sp.]|uniref:hypothetical protein n=1 Tax=Demequina sp. TaxID=2050685 RepID=UPI0025DF7203|nr:hypothetical protein [Demequina sp.]
MLEDVKARVAQTLDSDVMRTPPRPAPSNVWGQRYLRSYLRLRFFIGVVGIALPFALVGGNLLAGAGVQPSISGYYYTGMRDAFVGSLVAVGVFLVFYMVAERNFDNYASYVAGFAVLVVAFFPTDDPSVADDPALRVGAHYAAAVIFILALAAISFRFGWAGRRSGDPGQLQASGEWRLHYGCAAAIVIAVVFIVVSQLTGVLADWSILIGETVSVLAFGASWLAKGLELFRKPPPA